ncbi:hypothetical protein [Brachybacterium fresconis]|uniref:GNAT family N-acetyltransferase n=1 Tax=Brachybacterium fresconis TaxID=173363 RepID=A0ABS4YIM3_9MICO|nr:hypothetical protein [Brachybacterium fresconis]MBP2408599.1 hypothetical protein [Brachybacterium fresconis]
MTSHQLRPVREDDASAILEAFLAAPDMARQGEVATLEDAEEMVRWLSAPGRRGTAIARRDTDGLLERQKFLIDGARQDVHTYGRLVSDPVPATAELPWGR